VKYFTLTAQVLAKFVFYNILPKSNEYSHARGPVPLIVYCLLKGIKINFARFIISHMTSDHVLVPTRHLPYGTLITYLVKQLDFDLSSVRPSDPSVNLNSTLLKRMLAGMRHPAPEQPPIPPSFVSGSSSSIQGLLLLQGHLFPQTSRLSFLLSYALSSRSIIL